MAFAGLHPVVAVYATFLNRAFDQVLMDVALHRAGVTFVLDRAGITGDDGPSHNGMWDMALLRLVPGLRLAAPRDEDTLRAALRAAVDVDDAPTRACATPRARCRPTLPAIDAVDGVDVLRPARRATRASVLVVGVGPMAHTAVEVAELLAADGRSRDRRRPALGAPGPEALVKLVGEHDRVVVIEDGLVEGGVGALARPALRAPRGPDVPVQPFGIPLQFLRTPRVAQLVEGLRLRRRGRRARRARRAGACSGRASAQPHRTSQTVPSRVAACRRLDPRRSGDVWPEGPRSSHDLPA